MWITDLRLKLITKILDGIRCKIIKWHNKRRESSMKWVSNLVSQAERKLRKWIDKSRILSILNINELIFEVKDDAK